MFEKEVKILEKSKSFSTEEMFDDFEQAIVEILAYKDSRCIPALLKYLDDDCDYPDRMYLIIHAVESFSVDDYIRELCNAVEDTYKSAPESTRHLMYRALNEKTCFECLKKRLAADLDIYNKMKPILEFIAQESKDHKVLCDGLLSVR